MKQTAFSLHVRNRDVAANREKQLDGSDLYVVDVACGAIVKSCVQ